MSIDTNAAPYWDPFDIDIDTNPYPVWKRLRDEQPVYYNEQFDFYALSRYADVEAAHRSPALFSSAHGVTLEQLTPEKAPSGQMIMLDPPEHTRLRSMAARAFTPRRVAQMEDTVRAVCRELLDATDPDNFDIVEEYGAQLPSRVISDMLGVPPEERLWAKERIDTIFHIEPGLGMINKISFEAMIDLHNYLTELLTKRQTNPDDGLLTALLQEELTMQEAADFGLLLVTAGTETVARLLGWAGVVLDRHPEQRAQIAADPELAPKAVEELLRYEPPSPVQGRWSTADSEWHGVTIPGDSKVLLLTGSAGRDERKYDNPDQFDIHRQLDNHVSFGFGIHFCLGAALARLEGKIGIQELLARYPDFQVDHDATERLYTSTVRGWKRVPASA